MEQSIIYKIGRAGYHGAKKLLTFPKAFKEYPVYKKEFGSEIANAQFREQLFHYNVGYNERYIKIASKFMADELSPVIEKYKSEEFVQYKGKHDFNGKTPVWVCWWQGYENMPPIVKCCYDKIKKTYSECFSVVLITKENYREYIDLPGIILDKFEKNMMAIQHFADVMRWGLMALYGGIWFDATIFLTYDSPGAITWQTDMPFFTQRFAKESDCPNEPCRGKWSTFFFMGKHSPDIRLFQFVYDSALYYWERHNMAFHYVWPDYVLWTGYSELDDLRRLIDSVPPNNTNIWGMKLNDTYSELKMKKLMKDNEFYKLTYKKKLKARDRKGNLTFYGYLIK